MEPNPYTLLIYLAYTHKLPCQLAAQFQSHLFFWWWGAASRALAVSCLQIRPALPSLLVQGKTSKGGRENERGHFSLGPGVKLTPGLQALWTSDSSLICWITEWQSGGAGQIAGEEGGVSGDRNGELYCETGGESNREDTAGKSNLATPHLCKSHQIFPLTYF